MLELHKSGRVIGDGGFLRFLRDPHYLRLHFSETRDGTGGQSEASTEAPTTENAQLPAMQAFQTTMRPPAPLRYLSATVVCPLLHFPASQFYSINSV